MAVPTWEEVIEAEKRFDRRGAQSEKMKYWGLAYQAMLIRFHQGVHKETPEEYDLRLYLRDKNSERARIAARKAYTPREIEIICITAKMLTEGQDRDGRTVFYKRVGRKLGVGHSRIAQVYGGKKGGGLNWLSGTREEFRTNVLTAATTVQCNNK
jgi:hypothetical protein